MSGCGSGLMRRLWSRARRAVRGSDNQRGSTGTAKPQLQSMHLITCNAKYGAGGLGNLLAEAVERARVRGEPFRYIAGGAKAGDERIASIVGSRLSSAVNRVPPIRFNPGWRQFLTLDFFDRAAARLVDAKHETVGSLAGQ